MHFPSFKKQMYGYIFGDKNLEMGGEMTACFLTGRGMKLFLADNEI